MLDSVFTYGTLQVPAVMTAVTGKTFPFQPAVLPAYRCFKIRHRVYPAIIADSTAETTGTLYTGIDAEALALLDEFEDVLYDRLTVEVQTETGRVKAYAYVVADKYRHRLSDEAWDLCEFESKHLPSYLQRIR